jgi:MinD-like ATPase involved in chromosome partitioning or flagellar assembly
LNCDVTAEVPDVYVTTFYSFKGGVGRTLALANVGVELAQTGRRVLLIDFDLEAPGIDTFQALRPDQPRCGVVEYVTAFIANRSAPDVRDYIYEATDIGKEGGRLWVMPAGKGDATYQAKLAAINWQSLYGDLDGYFLFEDLKAQFKEAFDLDYLLIDSRTGYTDVGGICTRQLPAAVVVLFFPNEQNLNGLKQVVADIRDEAKEPRQKKINLHFVTSNVPDLDDEEQILTRRMREFRDALGYKSLTATVHRYDSLALLNQVIFTKDRPRSRLAKEYRRLKNAIVANNVEDREGALHFLQRSITPTGFHFNMRREEVEKRIGTILDRHSRDGELLHLIAKLQDHEGRLEDALALLDKAIEVGARMGEVFLQRAGIRQRMGDRSGAVSDAMEALGCTLDSSEVVLAVSLLRENDGGSLQRIAESPALLALESEDLLSVVQELTWSREGQATAAVILKRMLNESQITGKIQKQIRDELILCLIGLSRFTEAMHTVSPSRPSPDEIDIQTSDEIDIQNAFNYAMAEWGGMGRPPTDLFQRVVKLDMCEKEKPPDPNYPQCLAVAQWAVGNTEEARKQIQRAIDLMEERRWPEFSCWRYRRTSGKMFVDDCRSIGRLIAGENVRPVFFRD